MRAGSIDSAVASQTSITGSLGSASLRTVIRRAGTGPRAVWTSSSPATAKVGWSMFFIDASGSEKR